MEAQFYLENRYNINNPTINTDNEGKSYTLKDQQASNRLVTPPSSVSKNIVFANFKIIYRFLSDNFIGT